MLGFALELLKQNDFDFHNLIEDEGRQLPFPPAGDADESEMGDSASTADR